MARRTPAQRKADKLASRTPKREYVIAHKLERGCSVCGYRKCAGALTFHHLDPAAKEIKVSHATKLSWARLHAEIAKCTVVCANCHAELHAEERATRVPSGTTETVAP